MKDKLIVLFISVSIGSPIGVLLASGILTISGCQTAKVVHKRPNLRRIEAQVFTDEKNKLYIYTMKDDTLNSDPHFWKVLLVLLIVFMVILYLSLNSLYA